jgi:hypothetical protein
MKIITIIFLLFGGLAHALTLTSDEMELVQGATNSLATTNQLSIAAGKMGVVSVFDFGSAFTNYCDATQQ